jgi:hypothetical protein
MDKADGFVQEVIGLRPVASAVIHQNHHLHLKTGGACCWFLFVAARCSQVALRQSSGGIP